MKTTLIYTAAVVLFADAAFAFRLPTFLEPRQQQQQPPRCSLYSGFKDSPSFTSFCKQLPRATRAQPPSIQVTPSSSAHWVSSAPAPSSVAQWATSASAKQETPSISTQYLTFDGGKTSNLSPIDPENLVPSSSTYVMENYTVSMVGTAPMIDATTSAKLATTSSKPAPTDYEIHCEIAGSTLPMSECTRTAGLTRHHGYTYTPSTTSNAAATSNIPSAEVSVPATRSSVAGGPTFSFSGKPPSRKIISSSKSSSMSMVPGSSNPTTSSMISGQPTSSICTNTQNLTRHGGYTYSDTLTKVPLTTAALSSSVCTNTMNLTRHGGYTYPDTLSRVPLSTGVTSSSDLAGSSVPAPSTATKTSSSTPSLSDKSTTSSRNLITSSSLPMVASASTNCGNITGAEPHSSGHSVPTPSLVTKSKAPALSSSAQPSSAVLSSSSLAKSSAAKLSNSYDCNNITAAEPHRPAGSQTAVQPMTTPSAAPTSSAASTTSAPKSTSASTFATSFVNSYDCNNITAAEPHYMGSSMAMVVPVSSVCTTITMPRAAQATSGSEPKYDLTSTTTVIDATVTTVVPCPTEVVYETAHAEQKRDLSFAAPAADKLCDAGVYCVNSTFVSDAPPSWHWDAVQLKQGQTCMEDNVFNSNWLEAQCACAGM